MSTYVSPTTTITPYYPYGGSFHSTFVDLDVNNTWTLSIYDATLPNNGSLKFWSITVESCERCGDN